MNGGGESGAHRERGMAVASAPNPASGGGLWQSERTKRDRGKERKAATECFTRSVLHRGEGRRGGGALGRHFSQATHSHWQIRRGVGGSGRRAGAQMGDDDAYCGSGMGGEAVGSGGDGCSALRWQEREKERWKEEAGADKWSRLGN
jgi:hypothetical protein